MIPILFRREPNPEALTDVSSTILEDVNGAALFALGEWAAPRAFTSFGLGALTDCISCEVTEERNGAYELEMDYPVSGVRYDDIEVRGIIVAKPNANDDAQAFRIYQITTPINGVVSIFAQHISYDLSGVPVLPFTAQSAGAACAGLLSNTAVPTPFTIGTQIGTIADFAVDVPSSVRSWFGGKEGSLIDVYGGEWCFDNYTATLKAARGSDRGVVIRYGKNLIDFEQEENISNTWTGVLPFWQDMETGEIVRASIINVAGTFDHRRILCLDLSMEFEDTPTKEQLTARASAYISANNIGVPAVSISLDWVQQTDRVDLCDTVTVEFEKLGISAKAKCIKTVWDVLKDRYSRVEFGEPKTDIVDTIAGMQDDEEKIESTVSGRMLRAITSATEMITGNTGGYVVLHDTDDDGAPDEILVMDTDDIDTATKVWRWNKSGLGYSSAGYNGTYSLAMTSDGEIVADFITTGSLSADRINGGTITGVAINNGSGTFKVDNAGNVIANSLSSSNATITGGSIIINSANLGQVLQLINPNAPAYTKIGPNAWWSGDTNGTTPSTTWYRAMTGGSIAISGTLSQGSDGRKKTVLEEDVPDLTPIRAVRFKWNDGRDDLEHIGYIAQDVEAVAPDMVGEVGEYKTLDYIQVLTAKVEYLERRIEKIEGR